MTDSPADVSLSSEQRQLIAKMPATTRELADTLDIKPSTVAYHRKQLDKKGVRLVQDQHTRDWMLAGYQAFTIDDSRLPEIPAISPIKRVGIGLVTIIVPICFVWMLELLITTAELTDTILTFFIYPVPALAVYHGVMYALFISNWLVGAWIIATAFHRRIEYAN